MARTAVPPLTHVKNVSAVQDAGVAVDVANGHSIAGPTVSGMVVLLDIDSTFAGAKTFTVKSGRQQGHGENRGDLVISLNAQRGLVLLSSDQFAQLDGSFNIDVQAGATGTIRARYIPH